MSAIKRERESEREEDERDVKEREGDEGYVK